MNEAPVPPYQPDQPDATSAPTSVPQPAAPTVVTPVPNTSQGSSTLSTWSLILGIASLVLGLIIFISVPAAIVAIILGIVVLTKHRPGKGKALAGIITGGTMLLVLPFLFAVVIVAYNGINERVQVVATEQQHILNNSDATPTSDGHSVSTACFTYTIPEGYEFDDASKNCTTSVNIPNGDTLTRIVVKANTGDIGSLQDVVASYNKTLQAGDVTKPGVIDQEEFSTHGTRVYYVSYKDANGLLFGNYIIPTQTTLNDENGKPITAYTVAGYTYNAELKAIVRGVLDSVITE